MSGEEILYIDQYGNQVLASSVRELQKKAFGGRVSKMFADTKDGKTVHVGYVVGKHWFEMWKRYEKGVS